MLNNIKNSKLNARQIVQLQIVKAVEESKSTLLTEQEKSRANIAANSEDSDIGFLEKRTSFLFSKLPDAIRSWSYFALFPKDWIKPILIISFIFGLSSNYLGPVDKVHIIYNPLMILLFWNIIIYLALFFRTSLKLRLSFRKIKPPVTDLSLEQDSISRTITDKNRKSMVLNFVIGVIYKKIVEIRTRLSLNTERVILKTKDLKEILISFWDSFENISGINLRYRFFTLLNIGAIGLTLGALFGVFTRGIFFEYHFIWNSTFIKDIEQLTHILNFILGPACVILDGNFLTSAVVQLLFSKTGAPAADWIYRISLMAVLFILVPRTILAFFYFYLSNYKTRQIDFTQEYFKNLFEARMKIVDEVRNEISETFTKNTEKIADTIADFISKEYYDEIISPLLYSFKSKGGKLSELKEQIDKANSQFKPVLEERLQKATEDFKISVLEDLDKFLGKKLDIDLISKDAIKTNTSNHHMEMPDRIAENISDSISVAITAAVTTAVATISGGIGQSLGIAIISGLIGVSGPVGMIIGGGAAVLVAGGAYKLNRQSIANYIKNWKLPSIMLFSINAKNIEKTRGEIHNKVHDGIKNEILPSIAKTSEELINKISPNPSNLINIRG